MVARHLIPVAALRYRGETLEMTVVNLSDLHSWKLSGMSAARAVLDFADRMWYVTDVTRRYLAYGSDRKTIPL